MATKGISTKVTKVVSFRFGEEKEFKVELNFMESDRRLVPDSSSKKFMDFLASRGTRLTSKIEKCINDENSLYVVPVEASRNFSLFLKKADMLGLEVTPGSYFKKNEKASKGRSEEVAKAIRFGTNKAS